MGGGRQAVRLLMSWTIRRGSEGAGGSGDVKAWDDVWLKLRSLQNYAGSIRLEITDAPDVAPFSMSVAADHGNYLVTLLETTEDDTEVRSYSNPTAKAEMVEILGNDWDARHLTGDFELVCRMVEEFYRTGDVSTQWLN